MMAYFVHNKDTDSDLIYLPNTHCFVSVDRERLEAFISVDPDFASWTGEKCEMIAPEEFGGVIASREDKCDVNVLDPEIWRERMMKHLGNPL